MNFLAEIFLRLGDLGPWGPVVFVFAYIVFSVTLIPATLLTLLAGAVFGVGRGVPLVFISAVLGSSAAFGVARVLLRDRVLAWLVRNPRGAALATALKGEGFKVVFLLRLSPAVPYNLFNYVCGASSIAYRDFLLASFGMLPLLVLYTYYGKVIGDVAAVASGIVPPRGPEYYAALALGLAATVAVTVIVTRAAKRALEQQRGR
jgi:uncharacterized membrane protein YdjX (TVP38/TMEM64 family)